MMLDNNVLSFLTLGVIIVGVTIYILHIFLKVFNPSKSHKKYSYKKIKQTTMSLYFKDMFNYLESKYSVNLENQRKKVIVATIIYSIFLSILFVLVIFSTYSHKFSHNSAVAKILISLSVLPLGYAFFKYRKYNKIYVENFKENIIKNFVGYINHNFNYSMYGGANLLNPYLDAEFDDISFNKFVTDDYIEGETKYGSYMQICNISLENVDSRDHFLNIVYEGMFSASKLNNYIDGELRIKKNKYLLNSSPNKVEMDSKEFEKYFDVFSSSEILAMQILTHDVMEELITFFEEYKIDFEIVIKGNNIYIRFDTGIMFEPNIMKKANDMNTLWIYYKVLKFITNFTIKINKLLENLDI